jgi:hypothetical protein
MVRVTYVGTGTRPLILGQGRKIVFEDSKPQTISDEDGEMAREVNREAKRMIFVIEEVQTGAVAEKPKVLRKKVSGQPDVLDRLGPKRTVEDAISDKRGGVGLQ